MHQGINKWEPTLIKEYFSILFLLMKAKPSAWNLYRKLSLRIVYCIQRNTKKKYLSKVYINCKACMLCTDYYVQRIKSGERSKYSARGKVKVYCARKSMNILHCTVINVHCTVYSYRCTVYSLECTVYSLECTVYSLQCTVYSLQCTMKSHQCTVYSHQSTLSSVQLPMYSVNPSIYSTQSVMYCVQQSMYNLKCTAINVKCSIDCTAINVQCKMYSTSLYTTVYSDRCTVYSYQCTQCKVYSN